jgi:hypothetical protein
MCETLTRYKLTCRLSKNISFQPTHKRFKVFSRFFLECCQKKSHVMFAHMHGIIQFHMEFNLP